MGTTSGPAGQNRDGHGFDALVELMATLRSPGGCPWDRKQTMQSLRPYLVEETYEVLEAMEESPARHCEELGDLLLQVVFQARIAEEEGRFTITDVIASIHDKLVRRHPHIFGGEEARTPEEVIERWERIKGEEKARARAESGAEGAAPVEATAAGERAAPPAPEERPAAALPPPTPAPTSVMEGVPRSMPSLLRAFGVSQRAARVGFDWAGPEPVFDKIHEEIGEVRDAMASGDPARVEAEVGDLLFAVANLSRHLGVNPEDACHRAADRFIARFRRVEETLAARGKTPAGSSLEEMEELWEKAK